MHASWLLSNQGPNVNSMALADAGSLGLKDSQISQEKVGSGSKLKNGGSMIESASTQSNAGKISSAYESLLQKISNDSSLPELFKLQMDASDPLDEIKVYERNICKDN